jgi:hypothetical protein
MKAIPSGLSYTPGQVSTLTVSGGSGGNTFQVQGTAIGTPVTINAGAGNDTFNVGSSNSLNSIQGALIVNAGGGTNTLNANDSSSANGQSYTLSSTQLGRSGVATITYASIHQFNVSASGSETLTLVAPAPTALVTFHGGSGTNTLQGANVANTWAISGVNSGKVGNVTFDHFQNLTGGTSSDAFNFTTTIASVSGTLNGGAGSNEISYSTLGNSFLVNVTLTSNTSGTAPRLASQFVNINSVSGSTDTANTLTAPNTTNS